MYERSKLIRFAHCDPAGIVFYPRYVELCNEVVEDWFAEGLGVGFAELHQARRIGVPAVRLEVEFVAPSRIGDVLGFRLAVTELGRTSATLRIVAHCGAEDRVRFTLRIVQISLDSGRPVPWDPEWRERLGRFAAPVA
jgi:4-hydroxybenzoyl-CoA thioesterase